MSYNSRWDFTPPDISLLSFIFGSPEGKLPEDLKIFIDAKRSETYHFTLLTLREWSKRLAAGLVAAGLQQGDRVMLFSENNMFIPVVVLGVIMAGGIYNSANPAFTPRELAYQIKDSQPRFLLAAENCHERALQAVDLAKLDRECVFLFEDIFPPWNDCIMQKSDGVSVPKQHWNKLVASIEVGMKFTWEELDTPESTKRTAILIYSSGTTGLPKGVECTHRNLVSNISQLIHMETDKNASPASPGSSNQRRSLCTLPMYHGLGLIYYVCVAPKAGIQVFLMKRFHYTDMLSHIERHRITELILVPPILVAIAKHPAVQAGRYNLSSVRKVMAGAAPLGLEITTKFEAIWAGKVKVRQAWGMSEAPCIFFCWHENDNDRSTSISIGELVPGSECKIVDEEGIAVSRVGQPGELWIRGPSIMKGYWRNPSSTANTLTEDGWLKTGDIVYGDKKAKLYMVDRKKELIKVRGAQVAPAELEALLLEHPSVMDAAVIGIKTIGDDENPRAYVTLRKGARTTEQDIIKYVHDRVSKLKRLSGGVVFLSAIPKNPSGKILRRQLRELAGKELTREGVGNAKL